MFYPNPAAMNEIKAYILDSNVLVRQTLVNLIRNENGISFFGTSNGSSIYDIIADIKEKDPNVVFLGINEEDSNEHQLFFQLRKIYPNLPIIVITPINEEGAGIAISCLKHGAIDFISKPVNSGRLVLARQHFTKRLIPLIHTISRLNMYRDLKAVSPPAKARRLHKKSSYSSYLKRLTSPIELVVLGGCTGGVRSLFSLISVLPENLSVPIIIVQHMPKLYSRRLAQELNNISRAPVCEAKNQQVLRAGKVYVIPGGYHAALKNEGIYKTICLHRGPREENSRPSLNVLLRSASNIYRDQLLGVFLSGGGEDGLYGARNIVDKGGQVMLESKESALLWDLPEKLENQGIAMESLSAEFLGREIPRRVAISSLKDTFTKLPKVTKKIALPTSQV